MLKAKVISGEMFPYKSKRDGSDHTGYIMWYTFEGSPFSFKSAFFSQSDIDKAKAAVQAGSCEFNLMPNNNMEPKFVLK